MDNKYIDGKIYELISNNTDMVYVGSCIITLKNRLIQHKYKRNPTASKSIIDCGDYTINLIEKYPCNNDLELRMREQYYIDIYRNDGKNVINERNAYSSIEDKKEYMKQYYKEYMKEYIKEYRKNNKEKQAEYNLFNSKRVCNGFYNLSMMLNEY